MKNEVSISYVMNIRAGTDKSVLNIKNFPIRLIVTFNGNRYFCGIKHSVLVSQWDIMNRIVTNHPNAAEINKDIHDITEKIHLITKYKASTSEIKLSFEQIKNIVDDVVSEIRDIPEKSIYVKTVEHSFYTAFNQFLIDTEKGLRKKRVRQTHGLIARTTQIKYKTLQRKLLLFDPKRKLTFDSINKDFYARFTKFLQDIPLDDKKSTETSKLADSTVGNMIKILKAFLRYSFNEGWHSNNNYQKDYFVTLKASVQREYLTVNELKRVWYYVPETDKLKNVKNIFMFQCFSGIRYSDLKSLNRLSIDEEKQLIKIDQQKTDGTAFISLHPFVKKILLDTENFSKNWSIISNDKLNQYIQELCKKSEIDSIINPMKIVYGKKVNIYDTPKQKHEIITSHCGRHSFVTLCSNELGLPDEIVRVFSGHSSQDSLQRYKHNVEKRACQLLNSAIDEFIIEYDFDPFKILENSIEE